MCDCYGNSYWSYTFGRCIDLGTYGTSCSFSYQCQQSALLLCRSGQCLCPASPFYWSYGLQMCTN